MNQSMRYLKRYEMKIEFTTSKINQLNKEISEKQAIIKYLESKQEQKVHYKKSASGANIDHDSFSHVSELNNSIRGGEELSFAKLKNTTTNFESFKQVKNHYNFQEK